MCHLIAGMSWKACDVESCTEAIDDVTGVQGTREEVNASYATMDS